MKRRNIVFRTKVGLPQLSNLHFTKVFPSEIMLNSFQTISTVWNMIDSCW